MEIQLIFKQQVRVYSTICCELCVNWTVNNKLLEYFASNGTIQAYSTRFNKMCALNESIWGVFNSKVLSCSTEIPFFVFEEFIFELLAFCDTQNREHYSFERNINCL